MTLIFPASCPPHQTCRMLKELFILWKRWFRLSGVKQVTEAANCLWVRSTPVISTLSFKFKMSKFSPGRYFTQPYYLGSQGNMEVKNQRGKGWEWISSSLSLWGLYCMWVLPTCEKSSLRTGIEGVLRESHNDDYEFTLGGIYMFGISKVSEEKCGFSRAS